MGTDIQVLHGYTYIFGFSRDDCVQALQATLSAFYLVAKNLDLVTSDFLQIIV